MIPVGDYSGLYSVTKSGHVYSHKWIRSMSHKTYTELAKLFGVSRVQISNIQNRRQWKHI